MPLTIAELVERLIEEEQTVRNVLRDAFGDAPVKVRFAGSLREIEHVTRINGLIIIEVSGGRELC